MTVNDQRIRIDKELDDIQEQMQLLANQLSQDPRSGSSDADKANDLVERTGALSWYQHLQQKRWRLEHAKARLDQGVEGICEICGRPTDSARLEAIVGVIYCLMCQRRLEQKV